MVRWCSNICLQSSLPAAPLAFMSCFPTPFRDLHNSSGSLTVWGRLPPNCSRGALLPSFPRKGPGPSGVDIVWWHFVALLQPCQACHTSLCHALSTAALQLQLDISVHWQGWLVGQSVLLKARGVEWQGEHRAHWSFLSGESSAEPFTRSFFPHTGCSLNLGHRECEQRQSRTAEKRETKTSQRQAEDSVLACGLGTQLPRWNLSLPSLGHKKYGFKVKIWPFCQQILCALLIMSTGCLNKQTLLCLFCRRVGSTGFPSPWAWSKRAKAISEQVWVCQVHLHLTGLMWLCWDSKYFTPTEYFWEMLFPVLQFLVFALVCACP